jgi:hypothetical protein
VFSANVELPCRVFCGPDAMLEFSGTAVSIDTSSLILSLRQGQGRGCPDMGERVKLELLLPVNSVNAKAKCLTVRARVTRVEEMPDGSRQIGFSFRRASFKDRVDVPVEPRKAAAGWEM